MGQPDLAVRSSAPSRAAPSSQAGASASRSHALRGQGFAAQTVALRPNAGAPAQAGGEQKSTTIMQDIALAQDPNERERALLENDADAASAWTQAAAWAIGIATTYSYTRPNAGNSMYLGRADALRHFLWNAYMAYMLGEERARALADAHELPEAHLDTNSSVDREMDLRNNAAGRRLGVFHREQGWVARQFAVSLMASAAVSYINDGSLSVVDQRDSNNWKLVPSNTEGIN